MPRLVIDVAEADVEFVFQREAYDVVTEIFESNEEVAIHRMGSGR